MHSRSSLESCNANELSKPNENLSNEENELIYKLIAPRSTSLCTTIAQLLTAGGPSNRQWVKKCSGALCFVKDYAKRSFYFQIFCLMRHELMWEQELYDTFDIERTRPYLLTFEGEDGVVGLNFAFIQEADALFQCVIETVAHQKRRREERLQKSKKKSMARLPSLKNHQTDDCGKNNTTATISAPIHHSSLRSKFEQTAKAEWTPNTQKPIINGSQTLDRYKKGLKSDFIHSNNFEEMMRKISSRNQEQSGICTTQPPPLPIKNKNRDIQELRNETMFTHFICKDNSQNKKIPENETTILAEPAYKEDKPQQSNKLATGIRSNYEEVTTQELTSNTRKFNIYESLTLDRSRKNLETDSVRSSSFGDLIKKASARHQDQTAIQPPVLPVRNFLKSKETVKAASSPLKEHFEGYQNHNSTKNAEITTPVLQATVREQLCSKKYSTTDLTSKFESQRLLNNLESDSIPLKKPMELKKKSLTNKQDQVEKDDNQPQLPPVMKIIKRQESTKETPLLPMTASLVKLTNQNESSAFNVDSITTLKNECKICFIREKNNALLPCGHVFCADCALMALKTKICHICRSPVTDFNRIFL